MSDDASADIDDQSSEAAEAMLCLPPDAGAACMPLTGRTTWRIGRHERADILIPGEGVSRRHAQIHRIGPRRYQLADMGSRNGTYVNDCLISAPTVLWHHDRIRIGGATIEFRLIDPGGEAAGDLGASVAGDTGPATKAIVRPCLVTVLAIDIRDSCELARQLGEQRLAQMMSRWSARGCALVADHGAVCERNIGDALMSAWIHDEHGGPDDDRDRSLRVLRALRGIVELTQRIGSEFELTEPIRIGAGLNTGRAAMANGARPPRFEPTVWGDAVNLAFRLESATRGLDSDIVIHESTLKHMHDVAPQPMSGHMLRVKGFLEPHRVGACRFAALDSIPDDPPA